MNRIFKPVGVTAATLGLVVALGIVPATTFAAAGTTVKTDVKTGSAFCTNLSSTFSKVNDGITDKVSKLDAARTSRQQDLTANRVKWDADLAANRVKWDTERQANFTKLEAKATTDTEKAAVTTYEASVKADVATRRSANDAARSTFRSGVDAAITSRGSTVDGQVSALKSSVTGAESTAQAGCTIDANNGAALHAAFVASLKTARTTFQGERKDDDKVADQVKDLAAIKHAAIDAHDATFKAATAAARATLKSAFGGKDV